MKIKLDETYTIEGDEKNWILMRNNHKAYGYYSTIESLIKAYFDVSTRQSNASTITELLEYQKKLSMTLNDAIKPLKIKIIKEDTQ